MCFDAEGFGRAWRYGQDDESRGRGAGQCKFRDCLHEGEPGCAVQAAIAAGAFTAERLERWRKLKREDRVASASKAKVQAKVAERARIAAKAPPAKRGKRYREDG